MFIFVGSSFPYDGLPSPGSPCSGFDDSDVGPSIAGGGAGGGRGTLLYNGSCAEKIHKQNILYIEHLQYNKQPGGLRF